MLWLETQGKRSLRPNFEQPKYNRKLTLVVALHILSNILVFQWDKLRSSDATVINGNIAGQSDYAQAYMKEPMSAENLIYTWSIKIVNLSNPTSAGTSLGMATYPPAHGVDGFNDYDHRF